MLHNTAVENRDTSYGRDGFAQSIARNCPKRRRVKRVWTMWIKRESTGACSDEFELGQLPMRAKLEMVRGNRGR